MPGITSIFIQDKSQNTGLSSKILTIWQLYMIKHMRINKELNPFHLLASNHNRTEPLKGHVGEIFYVVRTTY